MTDQARPPLPPFTRESVVQKVRMAEDAWNSRDCFAGPRARGRMTTPGSVNWACKQLLRRT